MLEMCAHRKYRWGRNVNNEKTETHSILACARLERRNNDCLACDVMNSQLLIQSEDVGVSMSFIVCIRTPLADAVPAAFLAYH